MDGFICRENIKRFKAQIKAGAEGSRLVNLRRQLAIEEDKLRAFDAGR